MALSPMMVQYNEIKEQHKEHILFFRLGDFYEMFNDDAILASKELELVLTGRDCGLEKRAPMCGIPYHSCEAYIERLIKKGYKIAICEQVENPKDVKGIVHREVVRVVTPGTLIENSMLDESKNNFIASIYQGEIQTGLAVSDISTGDIYLTSMDNSDLESFKNELGRMMPREIVFNSNFLSQDEMRIFIKEKIGCCVELITDYIYESDKIKELIKKQFDIASREPADLEYNKDSYMALIGLMSYLMKTQKSSVMRLVNIHAYSENSFLSLDNSTRRNLELTQTMRTGERKGSLLWVIDKTKTSMGKRLMRLYIEQPLTNPVYIDNRLNAVDYLVNNTVIRMDVGEALRSIFDIERLMTRIVCRAALPRDIRALGVALKQVPALKSLLSDVTPKFLIEINNQISTSSDITELIEKSIVENPPATLKDGAYICDGYNEELDELRKILSNTKDILAAIELDEKQKTGIKNLKIGYNRVFGYYLEVTKSYHTLVPSNYIRKQTLSNCERFITEELKQLEDKILTASDKILAIENSIYEYVLDTITAKLHEISTTASAIAKLDVLYSFAQVAVDNNFTRPIITTNGKLAIKDGRHPVVEKILLNENFFIANDTELDNSHNQIAIITGPNMAGKSTYIRQVAIIALMAHIGCFVPAKLAYIPIIDGIYTRVGASDDLASGQSTFMVEMNEVAHILKNATKNSLLILDEVGRGTSTFDGMSIARAVIEYIANKKKLGAKTLFATHYHELTELEEHFDCIKNYNTAVKKRGEDVIFLRKIIHGAIDQSYGIEVSRLAGIPEWIIKRAREILKELESSHPKERSFVMSNPQEDNFQLSLMSKETPIIDELLTIDLDELSPKEALIKLYQLKALAKR